MTMIDTAEVVADATASTASARTSSRSQPAADRRSPGTRGASTPRSCRSRPSGSSSTATRARPHLRTGDPERATSATAPGTTAEASLHFAGDRGRHASPPATPASCPTARPPAWSWTGTRPRAAGSSRSAASRLRSRRVRARRDGHRPVFAVPKLLQQLGLMSTTSTCGSSTKRSPCRRCTAPTAGDSRGPLNVNGGAIPSVIPTACPGTAWPGTRCSRPAPRRAPRRRDHVCRRRHGRGRAVRGPMKPLREEFGYWAAPH